MFYGVPDNECSYTLSNNDPNLLSRKVPLPSGRVDSLNTNKF